MTDMQREQFSAYYYSFMATGAPYVDAVLRAVAKAGKAYHHTERWSDCDEHEESQVDLIQAAADNAAATWHGGNAAAEQRGWDNGYDAGRRDERAELRDPGTAATRGAYEQGQRDMLAKCIAAILARPERYEETSDYYASRDDGYAEGWVDDEGSILAALRALREKP